MPRVNTVRCDTISFNEIRKRKGFKLLNIQIESDNKVSLSTIERFSSGQPISRDNGEIIAKILGCRIEDIILGGNMMPFFSQKAMEWDMSLTCEILCRAYLNHDRDAISKYWTNLQEDEIDPDYLIFHAAYGAVSDLIARDIAPCGPFTEWFAAMNFVENHDHANTIYRRLADKMPEKAFALLSLELSPEEWPFDHPEE